MNEKVLRIAELCLEINQTTEYAAFFDISGHVNAIHLSVRKSKEDYKTILLEALHVSLSRDESKLDEVIAKLEVFLNGYELKPTRKYLQEKWVEEYETVVIQ